MKNFHIKETDKSGYFYNESNTPVSLVKDRSVGRSSVFSDITKTISSNIFVFPHSKNARFTTALNREVLHCTLLYSTVHFPMSMHAFALMR